MDGAGIGCMCYCGSDHYEISDNYTNERVCCAAKDCRYILCGRSLGTIDGGVGGVIIWLVDYDGGVVCRKEFEEQVVLQ